MNLTTSHAANLHSPSFDIVQRHQFQRCKCGCGELVNRTWAKGHCNRLRVTKQVKRVQIEMTPEDYQHLKLDAAIRGVGMSALLRELWRREFNR